MSINLHHGESSSRVRLEGVIDIADAAALKAVLVEALGRGKAVEVALENVTGLDVTAVQLIWSAQREAEKAALALHFSGSVPDAVSDALDDAGLKEHVVFAQNE